MPFPERLQSSSRTFTPLNHFYISPLTWRLFTYSLLNDDKQEITPSEWENKNFHLRHFIMYAIPIPLILFEQYFHRFRRAEWLRFIFHYNFFDFLSLTFHKHAFTFLMKLWHHENWRMKMQDFHFPPIKFHKLSNERKNSRSSDVIAWKRKFKFKAPIQYFCYF